MDALDQAEPLLEVLKNLRAAPARIVLDALQDRRPAQALGRLGDSPRVVRLLGQLFAVALRRCFTGCDIREITAYVRSQEPNGVTISLGGEIGEVGTENSTVPELRAYMDGFIVALERLAPGASWVAKNF